MTKTLAERLAEEDLASAAAEAALTEQDRTEIAQRAELARKREAREKLEEQKRALDLERRLEAAQDRHEGEALRSYIANASNTFILKAPSAAAYNDWNSGISKVTASELEIAKAKTTREAVNRVFAVQAVVDWNGKTDFSGATTLGHDLHEFFKANPPAATEIAFIAAELAKQAKEERKSGG